MSNIYYVYEHWRLDKDECFYVGKGHAGRAYSRKSRNSHWLNIVLKLERIGSGYEIRMVATGLTEEEAFLLEQERISFWKDRVDLSNLTSGGEGISGFSHSIETRSKMSSSAKKWMNTEDGRLKKSASLKGITFSAEARLKMSSSKKGKPLSESHKQKLSASGKGKKRSLESRQRLSEAAKIRESQKRLRKSNEYL